MIAIFGGPCHFPTCTAHNRLSREKQNVQCCHSRSEFPHNAYNADKVHLRLVPARTKYTREMLRVVSPFTLTTILNHHPCFHDNTVLNEVCGDIVVRAKKARLRDLRQMIQVFVRWERETIFWPRANAVPNLNHHVAPVKECIRYHGKIFIRDRFDVGIIFATFVPMGNRNVGVVWATNRKAYMFEYYLEGWVLVKVLNRQDDPFQTWLRHLGGERSLNAEKNRDERRRRSATQLFHDLVVPYYGTHPEARDVTRMRGIRCDDPVWELVKRVSYMIIPEDAPERFEWNCMF